MDSQNWRSWRWHYLPLLSWLEHFRATRVLVAFHTPVTTATSLHSFTLYLFLVFFLFCFFPFPCLHLSVKTSFPVVHPYSGHCTARISIHFQYPWLCCTNSFHVRPWALACLSSLSIWLDCRVPACGWLDSWHGIDSPNNARGVHGQAALPSQRRLFCGGDLLSESQGGTWPFKTWSHL